jgi:hypothetical protein
MENGSWRWGRRWNDGGFQAGEGKEKKKEQVHQGMIPTLQLLVL